MRIGARCNDGSYSSATGRGAGSHHGGVAEWLYAPSKSSGYSSSSYSSDQEGTREYAQKIRCEPQVTSKELVQEQKQLNDTKNVNPSAPASVSEPESAIKSEPQDVAPSKEKEKQKTSQKILEQEEKTVKPQTKIETAEKQNQPQKITEPLEKPKSPTKATKTEPGQKSKTPPTVTKIKPKEKPKAQPKSTKPESSVKPKAPPTAKKNQSSTKPIPQVQAKYPSNANSLIAILLYGAFQGLVAFLIIYEKPLGGILLLISLIIPEVIKFRQTGQLIHWQAQNQQEILKFVTMACVSLILSSAKKLGKLAFVSFLIFSAYYHTSQPQNYPNNFIKDYGYLTEHACIFYNNAYSLISKIQINGSFYIQLYGAFQAIAALFIASRKIHRGLPIFISVLASATARFQFSQILTMLSASLLLSSSTKFVGKYLFVCLLLVSAYFHISQPHNYSNTLFENISYDFSQKATQPLIGPQPFIEPSPAFNINQNMLIKIYGCFQGLVALIIIPGKVIGGFLLFIYFFIAGTVAFELAPFLTIVGASMILSDSPKKSIAKMLFAATVISSAYFHIIAPQYYRTNLVNGSTSIDQQAL